MGPVGLLLITAGLIGSRRWFLVAIVRLNLALASAPCDPSARLPAYPLTVYPSTRLPVYPFTPLVHR